LRKGNDFIALYNLGVKYMEYQLWSDALETFDGAAVLAPQDFATHHNKGVALQQLGRYAEAIEEFREASALRPGNAATLIRQGMTADELAKSARHKLSGHRGQPSGPRSTDTSVQYWDNEAYNAYKKATEAEPNYPYAQAAWASACMFRGHYD